MDKHKNNGNYFQLHPHIALFHFKYFIDKSIGLDNRLCLYKSSPTTRWNHLNTIYIRHRASGIRVHLSVFVGFVLPNLFCIIFCEYLFVFLPLFCYCIFVCNWLRFTASDYPVGIFKLFHVQ